MMPTTPTPKVFSKQWILPTVVVQPTTMRDIPGAAGFLEMEEDPSSIKPEVLLERSYSERNKSAASSEYEEPIRTASGLLLTHRRPPSQQQYASSSRSNSSKSAPVFRQSGPFNLEQQHPPGTASKAYRSMHRSNITAATIGGGGDSPYWEALLRQPSHLLRYVRLWVLVSALTLLLGTFLLVHHTRNTDPATVAEKQQQTTTTFDESSQQLQPIQIDSAASAADKIVLLPLPMMEQHHQQAGGGEGLVHVRRAPTNRQQQHHRRLEEPTQPLTTTHTTQQQQQQNHRHHHQQQQQHATTRDANAPIAVNFRGLARRL